MSTTPKPRTPEEWAGEVWRATANTMSAAAWKKKAVAAIAAAQEEARRPLVEALRQAAMAIDWAIEDGAKRGSTAGALVQAKYASDAALAGGKR